MNHSLTDKKAFSITELMVASALLILLLASALSGFVLLKRVFAEDLAKAMFQRDAAIVISKIIDGKAVSGGVRLSEASSVSFYAGDTGKLKFVGTDGVNRTYYHNNGGTNVLYTDDNNIQKTIYTAPPGAFVDVLYSQVNLGPTLCICVYVNINQWINGKVVQGSVGSYVYLRNHTT